MRRRAIVTLALAAAICVLLPFTRGVVSAGPLKGPKIYMNRTALQVPASHSEGVPGENEISVELRGNEKTYVLVKGDHKPVTDLEVVVVDADDRVVARSDKGAGDLVGVVFAPARTGTFRIVVRNPAPITQENPYNNCYVAIR